MSEEPTLADQLVATTHNPPAKGLPGRARKRLSEAMMHYRLSMRRAHRFVLDDEFVEYATRAATAGPEKTLARLQYATVPYETTWIEFNLHAKVRTIREIHRINDPHYEEIAQRLGILLHRLDDTTAVCTMVNSGETARTGGHPAAEPHVMAYYFSTIERDDWPLSPPGYNHVIGDTFTPESGEAEVKGVGLAAMWGYGAKPDDGGDLSIMALRTPEFLRRHGKTGVSPMYGTFPHTSDNLRSLLDTEINEFKGHMRWLVTVLAMLNEVPTHANYVVPQHQQQVGRLKKRVNWLDYHKVSLRLPKIKPLPWIERHLSGAMERRHRAHEVRAHWRTYLHETYCAPDLHGWEYDYENGYRLCGKCMAYSRLIHEHIRGNPELGWVRKDYVVKLDHQASIP